MVEIKTNGQLAIMDNQFKKSTLKVDNVVLAGVAPDTSLYEKLLGAGVVVERIGDAKEVRNLRAAVTEGANIALEIDEQLMLNANNAIISNLPTGVDD